MTAATSVQPLNSFLYPSSIHPLSIGPFLQFFFLRSVVLLSSPPIPHKSTHHPFPAPLRAARNRLKMTPTNLFPVQTSAPQVTTTLSIDIVPRGHLVLANPRQNYPLLSRRLFLCPPDPTRSSLCSRDNLHQLSYFTEASQRIGR